MLIGLSCLYLMPFIIYCFCFQVFHNVIKAVNLLCIQKKKSRSVEGALFVAFGRICRGSSGNSDVDLSVWPPDSSPPPPPTFCAFPLFLAAFALALDNNLSPSESGSQMQSLFRTILFWNKRRKFFPHFFVFAFLLGFFWSALVNPQKLF